MCMSGWTWIAITSGPSGQGNQTVAFHVTPNMGAARSGVIKIGPHDFIVSQESGSTFSIAPTSTSMPAADGPGAFNVTTSGSVCGWTAASDVPWINITGSATGTGALSPSRWNQIRARLEPARSPCRGRP